MEGNLVKNNKFREAAITSKNKQNSYKYFVDISQKYISIEKTIDITTPIPYTARKEGAHPHERYSNY